MQKSSMSIIDLTTSLLVFAVAFIGLVQIQYYLNLYIIGLSKLSFKKTYPAKLFYIIVFFPGVIIHEVSHLLSAMVLGVKTGDINIEPIIKENYFQLGSVKVAKTDIFRSTVIGIAPLVTGTVIIFFLIHGHVLYDVNLFNINLTQINRLLSPNNLILGYFIIVISNTMMLSKSDRRTFLPTFLIIIIFSAIVQQLLQDSNIFISAIVIKLIELLSLLSLVFFSAFFINLIAFISLFITVKIIEKIRNQKLVFN